MFCRMLRCLLLAGLGCGGSTCPKGNVVVALRDVSFAMQLQGGEGTLTGNGSSPPNGEGIAFDRATLPTSAGEGPSPGQDDLVLHAWSPGCHGEAAGNPVCDQTFKLYLTIHGVAVHPNLPLVLALDDQRAQLSLLVEASSGAMGACGSDKPGVADSGTKCSAILDAGGASSPHYAVYTSLRGQINLTQLAEDCTDALSSCALAAQGTFQLTAAGPNDETLTLTAGSLTATDTFRYRDTCED